MQRVPIGGGLHAWVTDPAEAEFLRAEIFDEQVYRPAHLRLDEDSVVLDVGANVGLASIFFAKVCGVAAVYAFEPVPQLFDALAANFADHGIAGAATCAALSDMAGRRSMTYYPRASAKSGFYPDLGADSAISRSFLEEEGFGEEDIDYLVGRRFVAEPIEVACETVSGFLDRIGLAALDLMKVDVEKSELDVLAGVTESDWRRGRIRQLLIEVNDGDVASAQIRRRLRRHGYTLRAEPVPANSGSGAVIVTARRGGMQKNW